MVVWDLPAIQRGVQSLKTSRIAPIYNTVAPSLEVFATLFGKALQAQVRATVAGAAAQAIAGVPERCGALPGQATLLPMQAGYPRCNAWATLQARIAAVNTILTCTGMWALKLPGVGLLSLFVFCCGFIPIAGTWGSGGGGEGQQAASGGAWPGSVQRRQSTWKRGPRRPAAAGAGGQPCADVAPRATLTWDCTVPCCLLQASSSARCPLGLWP